MRIPKWVFSLPNLVTFQSLTEFSQDRLSSSQGKIVLKSSPNLVTARIIALANISYCMSRTQVSELSLWTSGTTKIISTLENPHFGSFRVVGKAVTEHTSFKFISDLNGLSEGRFYVEGYLDNTIDGNVVRILDAQHMEETSQMKYATDTK